MVVVDGQGVPVGVQLASAQIAECRLAESTLQQVKVPRAGRGRPRSHLRELLQIEAMTPMPCELDSNSVGRS
jgi:hypothetical protein